MTCCSSAGVGACTVGSFEPEGSLQYIAPSNGNWGLVRVLCLLPESHILFVTPEACGRHTAFGALNKGLKNRVSYYFVSRDEIVSGYDTEIKQAVHDLLEILPNRPRAITVVVGCIDDLIGTDIARIIAELNMEIPDIAFVEAHMNPITANTKRPPLVTALANMYAQTCRQEATGSDVALATGQKKTEKNDEKLPFVNELGNFEPLAESCELHDFLKALGYGRARSIVECKTFEDFQKLGEAACNLLLAPPAYAAAEDMQVRLGIPFLRLFPSYFPETIERQYQLLYRTLCPDEDRPFPDLNAARAKAKAAVARAKKSVGDRDIWLCGDSVRRPFELAKCLLLEGFNLSTLIVEQVPPFDREAAEWLKLNAPQLTYLQSQHYQTVKFERRAPGALGIGFHAAYLAGSPYVVALLNDDFNFGYDGICRLMADMESAVAAEQNLEDLIAQYGLVI